MKKSKIRGLPFASTSVWRGPELTRKNANLMLVLSGDEEGRLLDVEIEFRQARAHRHRVETYCTQWHIASAYDSICEVEPSPWVKELQEAASPEWRDKWVMRHFMLYLDAFGCLEVIAGDVELRTIDKPHRPV